ncbi:MAG: pathogenicity-like protein, partial [Lysobacter sp.]
MRQVFSSPRLENVEGVAQFLREAGIEIRVTGDRSYKGNRRSSFSYSEQPAERPTVWVIRSEDQLRARDLLREAGLIDSTRNEQATQAPYRFRSDVDALRAPSDKRALRIKVGLLVCIAVVLGLAMFNGLRNRPAPKVA